ncbi:MULTISPECIES: hypothetical protein [unclassified Gordonia (in: high G+C Gram-positive bacteria)]|uniref:hypothetical protein n=1 Tax=unclassified Gordonia (in: high G+C Gram-positive bacteria) TaxID=2657482 RepID=UPI001FFED2D2|nr:MULTISPECIES: hypothetical protein [unclassified Gordonia (in: high G+C Gram-positive bacteria)]UQE73285.1 hypothetical protein MYK68_10915 [Gordonia sp. PP30]
MNGALSAGVALVFCWFGMVVAISFIEAPLKFQAPGITIPLGLGIGRLVFRALNSVESALAVALIVLAVVGEGWPSAALAGLGVAIAALGVQVVAVRPALTRRSDAVLADPENVPAQRSHAHLVYVAFEVIKVAGLLTAGIAVLS